MLVCRSVIIPFRIDTFKGLYEQDIPAKNVAGTYPNKYYGPATQVPSEQQKYKLRFGL
jgi:hypothetical protein